VKLHNPRTISFCQDITFRTDMGKLIFLKLDVCQSSATNQSLVQITISDLISDFNAKILLFSFRDTNLTSPKAPLPMILRVWKFSTLSFVRKKRRYVASPRRLAINFCCFLASGIVGSVMYCSKSFELLSGQPAFESRSHNI